MSTTAVLQPDRTAPGTSPSTGVHVREHRSVLAGVERRVLVRLASSMPGWVTPDHLSALGVMSMALAGLAFAMAPEVPWSPLLVVPALALNWFGDSLDGTLARVRNQQRPRYGFYLDHVLDLVGTAALLAGLGMSGHMSPAVALALLAAYFGVTAESFLATHSVGVFRISAFGWGPTELRILLAVGAACLVQRSWIQLGPFGAVRLFDLGGIVAIVGMAGVFIHASVRNARHLSLAEPRPPRAVEGGQA